MSDEPPPQAPKGDRSAGWGKTRLPFDAEISPLKGGPGGGGTLLLGIAAAVCIGVALYMGLVDRHPLTSMHVMAPAVGAAWFVMRLALKLSSRK